MEIILDGSRLMEPEEAHIYLAESLELPEYYGGNLDALFDCLTEISEDTKLILQITDEYGNEDYLRTILKVMKDAEDENTFLHITIETKE